MTTLQSRVERMERAVPDTHAKEARARAQREAESFCQWLLDMPARPPAADAHEALGWVKNQLMDAARGIA